MMKKTQTFFAAFIALAMLASAPAMAAPNAAETQSTRFGIMNMDGILRKSLAGENILQAIKDKRKEYEVLMGKEEAALKKEKEEIIKKRDKMSEADFDTQRKAFEKKADDAFKKVQERKQTLDYAFNQSMGKLREEVLKIAAEVARSRNLDAVFNDDAVILAEAGYDISEEVLARLNKDVKKVPVSFTLPKKK